MARCLRCKAGSEWIEGDPPKWVDEDAEDARRLSRYDEAIRLLRKLYDACETSIDGESEAEVWNFLDAEPKEGR